MNAIVVQIPDDVEGKLQEIAATRGMTIETLLAEASADMARQYEGYKLFLEMREKGKGRVAEGLALLRK